MMRFILLIACISCATATWLAGSTSTAEKAKRPAALTFEQRKDRIVFDGGVTVFLDEDPRVEIEAEILSGQSRLLEFLVVGTGGPVHEALFRFFGRAYDVHQGLEILGLRCGQKKLDFRGDSAIPDGPGVSIDVRYCDESGKERVVAVEGWILDTMTDAPMPRSPWTFTGSIVRQTPGTPGPSYLADQTNALVALWRDPSCVLNNRSEHGAVADVYLPNYGPDGVIQTRDRVHLILRPWRNK